MAEPTLQSLTRQTAKTGPAATEMSVPSGDRAAAIVPLQRSVGRAQVGFKTRGRAHRLGYGSPSRLLQAAVSPARARQCARSGADQYRRRLDGLGRFGRRSGVAARHLRRIVVAGGRTNLQIARKAGTDHQQLAHRIRCDGIVVATGVDPVRRRPAFPASGRIDRRRRSVACLRKYGLRPAGDGRNHTRWVPGGQLADPVRRAAGLRGRVRNRRGDCGSVDPARGRQRGERRRQHPVCGARGRPSC